MLRPVSGDEESRLDRELIELLNELRVTLPGVQVLFAFLLIVPFSQQFERVNDTQKYAYLAALVSIAVGGALLISPTPYHRIRFRDRDKEVMLRTANKLAIAGTVCLAAGMTAALFCVTDYLFKAPLPLLVSAAFGLTAGWFWFGLPLLRDARDAD
jgi:hypothetical protein